MKRLLPVYTAAAYLFLYLPLFTLGIFSFNSSKLSVWERFSWAWYWRLLNDDLLLEGARNSLLIATVATLVSTIIGTMAAYALWKKKASWLTDGFFLSLITPEILTGVSLLVFFQLLFRTVHAQLGMHTVVLAHISFSLAYVVLVVLARLRDFDPVLEDAALDLGADEWQTFCCVTLPLLLPAIIAAALLCFTVSFDDYVITSLVAGVDSETLPMIIYAMARRGVSPEVNALSVVITIGIGTLILAAGGLEQRASKRLRA